MLVEFVLIMEDLIVNGQPIDEVSFRWQTDISQVEIFNISHRWITTRNFLTQRMIGLQKVGDFTFLFKKTNNRLRLQNQACFYN
jgi:hypothetical protein